MTIEELKNIAQKDSNLKNISFENINKIKITTPNSEFRGKTDPNYTDNKLLCEILFDYDVVNNLSSSNGDIRKESTSIILHELFHYKEILITANRMDYHKLIFDDNYSDTYTMVLSIGYKQWTEYYAYYNSSKYHQRDILFNNTIRESWASLQVMYNALIEDDFIKMPFSLYSDIKNWC